MNNTWLSGPACSLNNFICTTLQDIQPAGELSSSLKMDEVLPFGSEELLDRDRIYKDFILNLISYGDVFLKQS